jgi:hypothetical protein
MYQRIVRSFFFISITMSYFFLLHISHLLLSNIVKEEEAKKKKNDNDNQVSFFLSKEIKKNTTQTSINKHKFL